MLPLDAHELLNREFLEIRARLLAIAASFDRIGRAEGDVQTDPRMEKLRQALAVLETAASDRAERMQLVFSRPYQPNWLRDFGLSDNKA